MLKAPMPYQRFLPGDPPGSRFRMLFQPAPDGGWFKAVEADSWAGLVAGVADDPGYEEGSEEHRLTERVRMAHEVALIAELEGHTLPIGPDPGPDGIDVRTDETFLRSLHRCGFASLSPELIGSPASQQ
jgi:hypothetical protein